MTKTYTEPARELPVIAEVDTLVVGAGPAGCMAACAAAAGGKKVMLIENRGFVGGNLALGLPILGFLSMKGELIIRGLSEVFINKLRERGACGPHRPCKQHVSLTIINPDEAKTVLLEMLEDAGVKLRLYTMFVSAIMEGKDIKGVIVESKKGREVILAKTVIDCTGDGDVAASAGVECVKGDENGGMQPPTLMFSMKGVDVERLRAAIVNKEEGTEMDHMPQEQFREGNFITVGMRGIMKRAEAAGLHLPVLRTILITGLENDQIWVNMTRVNGVDSTDPDSYTNGEIVSRKQVYDVEKYLKEFVPGFENAYIESIAPFLGIRESRVIIGKYVLTGEDLLSDRGFEDAIAVGSYPVDIHHPNGGDCTMKYCGDCYDLPYRVLVPEKVGNLLVAGRCSSMNHEAMAATRVMSTCMALGHAAGTAARLAQDENVKVADVNVKALREQLVKEGAYLKK